MASHWADNHFHASHWATEHWVSEIEEEEPSGPGPIVYVTPARQVSFVVPPRGAAFVREES